MPKKMCELQISSSAIKSEREGCSPPICSKDIHPFHRVWMRVSKQQSLIILNALEGGGREWRMTLWPWRNLQICGRCGCPSWPAQCQSIAKLKCMNASLVHLTVLGSENVEDWLGLLHLLLIAQCFQDYFILFYFVVYLRIYLLIDFNFMHLYILFLFLILIIVFVLNWRF